MMADPTVAEILALIKNFPKWSEAERNDAITRDFAMGLTNHEKYNARGWNVPVDVSLIDSSSPAGVPVIQNADQSAPTLVPRAPHKRIPTLDERRAGGDPYPEGPWRKMFPDAKIEYSYPGDDDYGDMKWELSRPEKRFR